MKCKLLFVVNVDSFFISHRLPIALSAIKQGYEVHIATVLTDSKKLLESHGLVVHPIHLSRNSSGIFTIWRTFSQIRSLFLSLQPDIVHLVTIKPVLWGGLAARIAGVPAVVSSVSGLGFVYMAQGFFSPVRRLLVNWLYRVTLGHSNIRVIFQNSDDLAYMRENTNLSLNKTNIICGSGVYLGNFTFKSLPKGTPVVLMASRLLTHKGLLEFVDVARSFQKEGVKARLVLAGEPDPGNPASVNIIKISTWVSEGILEYWGQRHDMPEVLATASIVVLPSYREGFPKVLMEAASCGRAIVTTDVPGCRDSIEPGVTGLLVPVKDSKALANAIKSLLFNPSRIVEMGLAGRKLAEKSFDVGQVVAQHMKIYKELTTRFG